MGHMPSPSRFRTTFKVGWGGWVLGGLGASREGAGGSRTTTYMA